MQMRNMEIEVTQRELRMDIEYQNLQSKARLAKEALDIRNDELQEAEENNQKLLELLEQYDTKIDFMQEEIDALKQENKKNSGESGKQPFINFSDLIQAIKGY